MIVVATCAKRAVGVQPFDRLTAQSESKGWIRRHPRAGLPSTTELEDTP
jgi:hypothetical protein